MGQEVLDAFWKSNDRIYNENPLLYPRLARACGLPDCAFWLLYTLRSEEAPLTQTQLSEQLSLPKQTVNSAVANLVQKGLVYLEPGKGRSKYIRPSEAGQKIIQEKIEPIRRAECLALQQMTPEERRYLVALTDRYIGLLHTEMTREAEKFKRKGASEP